MTYLRDPRNPLVWESDGVYNDKFAAEDGTLHDSAQAAIKHDKRPAEAQPQPRGSEALANTVLRLAKSMNQSNIWALRNEIMELCEGAAAPAERTPPPPSDFEYRLYGVDVDKIIPPRQPAPPQPEEQRFRKALETIANGEWAVDSAAQEYAKQILEGKEE